MDNNNDEKVCPTVLLADNPAEEDAFRHRYISRAIADMILHEDGGRAIALTGPWGSGKSSVVSLLSDELSRIEGAARVINFDAWAHQGDPLRRTFLELAKSELEDLVDRDKWERNLAILSRRLVESKTISHPELTTIGALGAFALLVAPVGYQLFAFLTKDIKGPIPSAYWIFFALGAAPLAAATWIGIIWLRGYMQRDPKPLPSFIYSASENTVVTSSSRTAEPTSVEFESSYCELLKDATKNSSIKILIVIDNLDRLDEGDAKTVWATLRTFFDKPLRKEEWFKKVWILVPIHDSMNDKQNANRATLTGSYVDKTFQAFFRIPPALLTNWEAYLIKQLGLALPNHKETAELHTIFRLFDSLRISQKTIPTPRELKLFVNKVGSLHRQWQHQIPLSAQAAFILLIERYQAEFPSALQASNESDFISEPNIRRLNPEWQRDLAALYFNVEPEDAFEALLAKPVTAALTSSNHAMLSGLEESPGFGEVLQSAVENQFSVGSVLDQSALANAILAVSPLTKADPKYGFCRKLLLDRALAIEKWQRPDADVGEAIVSIAQQNKQEGALSLKQVLEASIPSTDQGILLQPQLSDWCLAALEVASAFCNIKPDEITSLCINVKPPDYITIVNRCARESAEHDGLRYLKPSCSADDIVTELCSQARDRVWDTPFEKFVATKVEFQYPWIWSGLLEVLCEKVILYSVIQPELTIILRTIDKLMSVGWFLKRNSSARLLADEACLDSYSLLDINDELREAALLAALLLWSNTSFALVQPGTVMVQTAYYGGQTRQEVPLTSEEKQRNSVKSSLLLVLTNKEQSKFREEIFSICQRYFTSLDWRLVGESQPDRLPFIEQLVANAIEEKNKRFFELSEILENIDFWDDLLGNQIYANCVRLIDGNGEVADWLGSKQYQEKYDLLYEVAVSSGDNQAIRDRLTSAFQEMETDTWIEAISGNQPKLRLLSLISSPELGIAFEKALISFALSALHNDEEPSDLAVDPLVLAKALSANTHRLFSSQLVNEFSTATGAFRHAINLWGQVLANSLLEEGVERAHERFVEIIGRADQDELSWIAQVLKSPKASNGAGSKMISELKAVVRNKLTESGDEGLKSRLRTFANSIGWQYRIKT